MFVLLNLRLRRDVESETETGDFEKLSRQSGTTDTQRQRTDTSTTCAPDTMAVSTVTEVRTLPVILETPEGPPKAGEEFENSEFYIEESLPSSLDWGRSERQVHIEPP